VRDYRIAVSDWHNSIRATPDLLVAKDGRATVHVISYARRADGLNSAQPQYISLNASVSLYRQLFDKRVVLTATGTGVASLASASDGGGQSEVTGANTAFTSRSQAASSASGAIEREAIEK
jgi:hypothetical protein